MEESEFTSNANMFENMDIAQKGFARESEIHLYQYESKLGQRYVPYPPFLYFSLLFPLTLDIHTSSVKSVENMGERTG
jgi:hypothetical protein